MTPLSSMKNIGKEMTKKLTSIGINSAEQLLETGSKQTFIRLKTEYPNVCFVHLFTLESAIENINLKELSESKRTELKEFYNSLQ